MRTRGAVEDLVVVDLDDPDEVAGRGPAAQRRQFEDRYAELPFGLGTVPRRLDHPPWYARPGVVVWIFLALIGVFAIADRTDTSDGATPPAPPIEFRVLTEKTHARLLFSHLDAYSVFDVDAGTFQQVEPFMLAGRAVAPPLILESGAPDPRGRRALIARSPSGSSVVSRDGSALAYNSTSVVWRPSNCRECPIRMTNATTGRITKLGRTNDGGATRPVIAPNGSAVALLDYTGPNHWELRLVRASGRTATHIDLATDVVTMVWSRDSRWLFAVAGASLLAIDRVSGQPARIGNTLPPFETLEAY